MKQITLTLMLAVATLGASAQTTFGIKAGANSSSFSTSNTKTVWGFHAGATMSNKLAPGWEVNSSLLYFTKGTKSELLDLNLNYLELSVLPTYALPTLPSQALLIKVGPYAGYGLNSSSTIYESGKSIKSSSNFFNNDKANRIDFGLGLGAAYRIGHFEVGMETRFGLLNVGDGDSKNQNVMFSVGYNF